MQVLVLPAVLFVQVGAAGYEAGRGSASCASRRPAADAVQVVTTPSPGCHELSEPSASIQLLPLTNHCDRS